jgi:hypothetical protein
MCKNTAAVLTTAVLTTAVLTAAGSSLEKVVKVTVCDLSRPLHEENRQGYVTLG